jgi:hypothetical protein
LKSWGYDAVDEEMALADIFNFDKRGFEQSANSRKIGFKNS